MSHRPSKRTMTKEQTLSRIRGLNPEQVYGLHALAHHVQVNAEALKEKARMAGCLFDHPTRRHKNAPVKTIKGSDAVPILVEMCENLRKPLPPRKSPCPKRTLTKEQILSRTKELNPEQFYRFSPLAKHLQVSDDTLKRKARERNLLREYPSIGNGGKLIRDIKGSDAVPILMEMCENLRKSPRQSVSTPPAPPPVPPVVKRSHHRKKVATPAPVAPVVKKSHHRKKVTTPAPVQIDFVMGIEVYTRLEKDLSQYPVEMASVVVSVLSKKFQPSQMV